MTYTISPSADKEIERNFKKINEVIVKELNPISIILFGGLGKGEGSLYKGELFNDIDMYVVTKDKVPEKRLEEVDFQFRNYIIVLNLSFRPTPLCPPEP